MSVSKRIFRNVRFEKNLSKCPFQKKSFEMSVSKITFRNVRFEKNLSKCPFRKKSFEMSFSKQSFETTVSKLSVENNLSKFCAETSYSQKIYFTGCIKNRNLGDFFMFFRPEIFFKNDPIRANFMRGIDCTHSRSLKTLP